MRVRRGGGKEWRVSWAARMNIEIDEIILYGGIGEDR